MEPNECMHVFVESENDSVYNIQISPSTSVCTVLCKSESLVTRVPKDAVLLYQGSIIISYPQIKPSVGRLRAPIYRRLEHPCCSYSLGSFRALT